MTQVLIQKINGDNSTNSLQSTKGFDRFGPINERPTVGTVGLLKNSNSVASEYDNGSSNNPIIFDAPNLYKNIGASMSDEGFIKLPKALFTSDSWRCLRIKQQKLFLFILQKAQYTYYTFRYNGKPIELIPGDLCVSLRRLSDDYNSTVKFKEEKIDVPFIQRAVSAFAKSGLADTRTDTGISIIRVTFPGIYNYETNQSDTRTDTDSIQRRYTNEERKEREDIRETIETIEGAEAPDSFLFHKELEERCKKSLEEDPLGKPVFEPDIPSKSTCFNQDQEVQKNELWEYAVKNKISNGMTDNGVPGIKEKDIVNWLKTPYDGMEIFECMKAVVGKNVSKSYAAYVESLLKKRVSKRAADRLSGKEMVRKVIEKNKMHHIEMKQDYFTDLISKEHVYYHLPHETLIAILKRSYEKAKEGIGQEKSEEECY